MKLFGQLVRTAVNVATLPVNITKDAVMSISETSWPNGPGVGHRTKRNLERLRDEAMED